MIAIVLAGVSVSLFDWVKIIVFILIVLSFFFERAVQENVAIAAATRMYIDYSLFGFEFPHLFGRLRGGQVIDKAIEVEKKNKAKAELEYQHSGDDPQYGGVRDWYTGIDPETPENMAIFQCQKENCWWDHKLTELHLRVLKCIGAAFGLVSIIIFYHKTVLEVICFLIVISPLVKKIIGDYGLIREYRNLSASIQTLLDSDKKLDPEFDQSFLLQLQRKIDERRALSLITPRILHAINRRSYHKDLEKKQKFGAGKDG